MQQTAQKSASVDRDFEERRKDIKRQAFSSQTNSEEPAADQDSVQTHNFSQENQTEEGETQPAETQNNNSENSSVESQSQNDYISNESSHENAEQNQQDDEEIQKLQNIVDNTFGGDPLKAAKSWREAQKAYTQLREELNNVKSERDGFVQFLKQNPNLAKTFEEAYQSGEDIQNFFGGEQEPRGKPESPTSQSKLDDVNPAQQVSEQELVRTGFVDQNELSHLTPEQRELKLQRAELEYMKQNLPQQVMQQIQQQNAQEQQKRQQEDERKRIRQTNSERYRQGVESVIDRYGLDLTGSDKELLDAIDKRAVRILDTEDSRLIDPNAVETAAQLEMQRRGIEPKVNPNQQRKEETERQYEQTFDRNTFSANTRQPSEAKPEPNSVAERMAQKLQEKKVEQFKNEQERRNQIDRNVK